MASSYTTPLTVVRDVETSIWDAAVLEFLHAGQTKKMERKSGKTVGGGNPGGSNKLQSLSTQENVGGVKNGLVNNVADGEDG